VALIDLLGEQLLPQFLESNYNNYQLINEMHNLCFLFSQKVQSVFNSNAIRTCID